jgi:hypothetical protein
VTELIHRADALEKFEATGTLYQHAIQKIAVAQASSTTTPVQQIIKSLNELATKAIARVYRDVQARLLSRGEPGGFGALADKLADQPTAPMCSTARSRAIWRRPRRGTRSCCCCFSLMAEAPRRRRRPHAAAGLSSNPSLRRFSAAPRRCTN